MRESASFTGTGRRHGSLRARAPKQVTEEAGRRNEMTMESLQRADGHPGHFTNMISLKTPNNAII